ncbi:MULTISPECIES: ABC transporter permease [Frankia]|uniref:ABC transporter integral membrane protein n=1 Tax=Frankia alni (strain DSM 45986 / CECT 9034 / ACN14a) TaxID=326424 RepID=Q0RSW7_FRAAA|nr:MULTISPECIES: ABC transporter permease [Frankia]CAJ59337.1 Putative ABC transporter integral membrane protein [Frankia alni ACN14a]
MNLVLAARRSLRAELIKLWRPSTAVAMAILAVLSVLSTALLFGLADAGGPGAAGAGGSGGFGVTTGQVSAADGMALGFISGSTFTGLLIFLVFAITITLEYSQGTLRTLFLREPRRLGWLAGRMSVMLALTAAALIGAVVLSVGVGYVTATLRGIDTSAWWSGDGVRHLASGYLNALVAAAFFGVAGTVLGLVLRSTALTLAVGVAWTFPIEHIIQESWGASNRVLPGLVFDAIGQGGVSDAGYGTALLVGTAYAMGAALLGAITLARRDVTA